jgi:hypothetical protein
MLTIILSTQFSVAQITYDWAAGMGGQTVNAQVIDIASDPQGNTYITGEFEGTKTFGPYSLTSTGTSAIYVAKYNASGVCQWAIKGGANFSSANAGGVAYSDGYVYATGHFVNTINFGLGNILADGFSDVFVVKLDPSDGTAQWVNKMGGNLIEKAYAICENSAGGVFVTGTFSGTANFGSNQLNSGNLNNINLFVANVNDAGSCTWAIQAGNSTDEDLAYDIAQSPNGDLVLSGFFYSPATFGSVTATGIPGGPDLFLASFNPSNGNTKWVSTGGSDGGDWGTGIGFDPNNNIYLSGFIGDTASFGPFTIPDNGYGNIFIGKYNSNGVVQWVKSNGSISNDSGLDIVTDFGGSSYVTGYVTATADFDGTLLTGTQLKDAFVCKYSTDGTLRWVTKIGGSGFDTGHSIFFNQNGKVTVAGEFFGNVNIGGTLVSAPTGEYSAFVTKMGGGTVGLNEQSQQNVIEAFPNPASEHISITIPQVNDALITLEIIDLQGKTIISESVAVNSKGQQHTIDVSTLSQGSYIIRLDTSEGVFVAKNIIIE